MDLQFDLEKIKDMKTACETAKMDLEKLDTELTSKLEQLKKDWNTPAGDKFFEELDNDWTAQVQSYTRITGAIVELLEAAIAEYESVETEANELKIV